VRWYSKDGRSAWYGSNHSDFDHEHPLEDWQIPSQPTTFYLSTNLAETMFARIIDTVAGTVYGAKFDTVKKGCNLVFTPEGALELEAGVLISDDPKIQIHQGTRPKASTCSWEWHGAGGWTYAIDDGAPQPYDCTNHPSIALETAADGSMPTLSVIDHTGNASRCAVYYADSNKVAPATPLPAGTAVGLVQTCVLLAAGRSVDVPLTTIPSNPTQTCTLNLFTDRMTRLALATG
jgi:hypothetical protein